MELHGDIDQTSVIVNVTGDSFVRTTIRRKFLSDFLAITTVPESRTVAICTQDEIVSKILRVHVHGGECGPVEHDHALQSLPQFVTVNGVRIVIAQVHERLVAGITLGIFGVHTACGFTPEERFHCLIVGPIRVAEKVPSPNPHIFSIRSYQGLALWCWCRSLHVLSCVSSCRVVVPQSGVCVGLTRRTLHAHRLPVKRRDSGLCGPSEALYPRP